MGKIEHLSLSLTHTHTHTHTHKASKLYTLFYSLYYFFFNLRTFVIDFYALDDQNQVLDPDTLAMLLMDLTEDDKNVLLQAGFVLDYQVSIIIIFSFNYLLINLLSVCL